jgi:hypothetical protein
MTRRAWIAIGGSLGLALILAIALIVVVATDDDSSGTSSPSEAPSVQFGGQLPSDVQECLSQKGIEPPSAGQAPDGSVDPEELQQALEDCGASPPAGAVPFGSQAPGSG